jgi:hypothetical protein
MTLFEGGPRSQTKTSFFFRERHLISSERHLFACERHLIACERHFPPPLRTSFNCRERHFCFLRTSFLFPANRIFFFFRERHLCPPGFVICFFLAGRLFFPTVLCFVIGFAKYFGVIYFVIYCRVITSSFISS